MAIKIMKREDVSSTRNALSTAVLPQGADRGPLSPPGAKGASHGAIGAALVMNLEDSLAGSNLPGSKSAGNVVGGESEGSPAPISPAEAVDKAWRSQTEVNLFDSKARIQLSEEQVINSKRTAKTMSQVTKLMPTKTSPMGQ